VPPGCRLDLVVIACTSRQSWAVAFVGVGVGVGVGVADPEPLVGDGVGVGFVVVGLAEAELVGLAAVELDALDDVVGVAASLALLLALLLLLALISGVALLLDLALALALDLALELALDLALAVAFGVLADRNAASSVTVVCPPGTVRAALAAAGGEPHALGAATAAGAVTAASAGLAAPSRPPAMPDDITAAPATAPSAVVADRADLMAVLS